jgi:hypothetical protein
LIAVAIGEALTIAAVVIIPWHPVLFVTVREYVPAIATVDSSDTVGL